MKQNNDINKGINERIAELTGMKKSTQQKLSDLDYRINYLKALKRNASNFSLGSLRFGDFSEDRSSIMPYFIRIISSIEQNLNKVKAFAIEIPFDNDPSLSARINTIIILIGREEVIEITKLISSSTSSSDFLKETAIKEAIDNFNSLGLQVTMVKFERVADMMHMPHEIGDSGYNVITPQNIPDEFPYLKEFLERLILLRLKYEIYNIGELNKVKIGDENCGLVDVAADEIINKYRDNGVSKKLKK